jgi:hypothetical protein
MATDSRISSNEVDACKARIISLERENAELRRKLREAEEELAYERHCRKPRLTVEKIVNNDKMVRSTLLIHSHRQNNPN